MRDNFQIIKVKYIRRVSKIEIKSPQICENGLRMRWSPSYTNFKQDPFKRNSIRLHPSKSRTQEF